MNLAWPGWQTSAHHKDGNPGEQEYWMGSLVDGMRDASGQIYMRNRYYDPATGQFTQTDPIGLAGGLNAYGFAAGDPVSFSDPYGLCPEKIRAECERLVARLRAQSGSEFQKAADVYEQNDYQVVLVPGDSPWLDDGHLNTDGRPNSWTGGATYAGYKTVFLNADFSDPDQLVVAVHESVHITDPDGDEVEPSRAAARAYQQLPASDRAKAERGAQAAWEWTNGRVGKPIPDVIEHRTPCSTRYRTCPGN